MHCGEGFEWTLHLCEFEALEKPFQEKMRSSHSAALKGRAGSVLHHMIMHILGTSF